eukprot:712557-Pleurochrysis_carterae.AAC.1
MKEAFQYWKALTCGTYTEKDKGKEHEKDKGATERTYGIKHWGRIRTILRLHKQVKRFFQTGSHPRKRRSLPYLTLLSFPAVLPAAAAATDDDDDE